MIIQKIFCRLTSPCFPRKLHRLAGRILRNPAPPPAPDRGLDRLDPKRVLLVLAHPDDEIFCSGLVCESVARGASVELLCLTSGEGGMAGCQSREELGGLRRQELRAAAAELGIGSVEFLGYPDPPTTRYRTFAPDHDPAKLREELRNAVRHSRADTVITHGSEGEYWHVAHFVLHDAVRDALRDPELRDIRLLTINAWNPGHQLPKLLNRSDPAHLFIDGARHSDKRLAALRCHASQAGYFQGAARARLEDFIDATAREQYRLWKA